MVSKWSKQSSISDVADIERVVQQSTERDQRVGGPLQIVDLIRHISLNRLPGGCSTS
jgi:hypothetical protein